MVLLYTGDGKGKTTAAMGLCLRALGWGKRICMIQFLKSPDFVCGERNMLEKIGVELHQTGIGYSWTKTPQEQIQSIQRAWELTKEKLLCDAYDMIVLDEIINVFSMKTVSVKDFLTEEELIVALEKRKKTTHVVLTGRNADKKLMAYADLVTEMKEIKHYYQKGVTAKKGLEY